MIWVDQTLNEGLRLGMDKGNINSMVELLSHLQVTMIDVRITDWQKYSLSPLNSLQQDQLRGKVSAKLEEVDSAYQLGFKKIIIACRPTRGEGLGKQVITALSRAQKLGMNIGLCIENASEFSIEEIEGLWGHVSTMGVETFVYSDGDSLLNPLVASRILTSVVQRIPALIEFHGHNAYGLGTANALGAIEAGVQRIATAVAGVGERGHGALEEMIMIQKSLIGTNRMVTENLACISSQIVGLIGVELSRTKAIIGQDIFAHESGIHVDGVLKNPRLYEAFAPEEVGLERKLVIGKHSGAASIRAKFQQRSIVLSFIDSQQLLKKVRNLAVTGKKAVDDDTLWEMYQDRVV